MQNKLTTEDFIKRAREVHGDKYGYSKVNYKNSNTKVDIICPAHGVFTQRASNHLRGIGCPKCKKHRSHTLLSTFIERAKSVHGDFYDYSLVDYVSLDDKINIICPKHGVFQQIGWNHIAGKGCSKCWSERRGVVTRKSTLDFISKARKIHGDFYDYTKTIYIRGNEKVIITCPIHGDFEQLASNHLKGEGCRLCGIKKSAIKYSKKAFVEKTQAIHHNFYDYTKSEYTHSQTPIVITCPIHGDFIQTPANHLKGEKCPLCAHSSRVDCLTGNKEDFIKQAKVVHGDKYDYSLVDYKKSSVKVKIVCPKHGVFLQSPNNHLRGKCCPKCNTSKGEERIFRYLDTNQIKYVRQFKMQNENIFCVNKILIADFFLPDYGIIIEYNGEQHYKPIPFWGGESQFEKQKERDITLRMFCKRHNYKLIEIPYLEYNNIEVILKREIRGKQK